MKAQKRPSVIRLIDRDGALDELKVPKQAEMIE
jgi:hypothetical protein